MEEKSNENRDVGNYLIFKVFDEEFCIETDRIQEIISDMEITKLPQTSSFIKGIINLRGTIAPIIDLRKKFNHPEADESIRSCIIVFRTDIEGFNQLIGLVVDGITEVLEIPLDHISDDPLHESFLDTDYILGVTEIDNVAKIILDIDNIVKKNDFVMSLID